MLFTYAHLLKVNLSNNTAVVSKMQTTRFYLPHMEYEGSIGFVFFFIADFHVLGLFMAKKHDLSVQFFSVCHAPGPLPSPLNAKFVPRLQPRPYDLES
jgi:hypothetical protein